MSWKGLRKVVLVFHGTISTTLGHISVSWFPSCSTPLAGIFGDPKARVIRLVRRGKKRLVECAACSSFVLRPEDPKGSGSLLRGCCASYLEVEIRRVDCRRCKKREAGETGLACGQSFLHQAIWLLCGPAVSGFGDHGCGQGTAPGLEDGQGSGKAIHAGAVEASGTAWAEGDRHRRDLYPQGAYVTGSWSAIF